MSCGVKKTLFTYIELESNIKSLSDRVNVSEATVQKLSTLNSVLSDNLNNNKCCNCTVRDNGGEANHKTHSPESEYVKIDDSYYASDIESDSGVTNVHSSNIDVVPSTESQNASLNTHTDSQQQSNKKPKVSFKSDICLKEFLDGRGACKAESCPLEHKLNFFKISRRGICWHKFEQEGKCARSQSKCHFSHQLPSCIRTDPKLVKSRR